MSENIKRVKSRVINKHETEANWKKAVNFIPEQAEHIVYDIDENYNYERLKIGDGVTPVNDLPFYDENIIIPSSHVVHGEGENEKPLSEIIEDKQDKLEFDTEPKDNSDNPITSGGVFNALKNIPPSTGGGTTYTAGDLIEIENNVISSTLGKATTVEGLVSIVELNDIPNGNSDMMPPWFMWDKYIDDMYYSGQEIHVSVIDTEGNEIYVGSGTLTADPTIDVNIGINTESYNEYGLYCCINSSETNLLNLLMSGSIIRADESIPYGFGIAIMIKNDETPNTLMIASDVDYPGITIKIQENKSYETFEKIPINASPLKDGNLIEIKNGKINSTIGKRYINNVRENIYTDFALNGDNTAMPPFYVWHTSVDQFDIKIGDKIYLYCENQTENIMKFIGSEIFEQVDEIDVAMGVTNRYLACKFNVSSSWADGLGLTDGVPKIEAENSNIVVNGNVACFCLVYDTENNYMTITSLTDHPSVIFKIGKDIPTISYVKLPNEALDMDESPVQGSSRPVTSDGIYNALQNVSPALNFDHYPTQGSSNPVTSDGIYNALQNVTPDLSYDSTPTEGSLNPVTSDGIYKAIKDAILSSWGEEY